MSKRGAPPPANSSRGPSRPPTQANGKSGYSGGGKEADGENFGRYGGTMSLVERCKREDALDLEFGFPRLNDSSTDQIRLGWLINAHPVRGILLIPCRLAPTMIAFPIRLMFLIGPLFVPILLLL